MDETSWQARAEEHERWLARMRPMMERMAVHILNHEERMSQNERTLQEVSATLQQHEATQKALISTLQEIRDRL